MWSTESRPEGVGFSHYTYRTAAGFPSLIINEIRLKAAPFGSVPKNECSGNSEARRFQAIDEGDEAKRLILRKGSVRTTAPFESSQNPRTDLWLT